jgi:hypothetical protein
MSQEEYCRICVAYHASEGQERERLREQLEAVEEFRGHYLHWVYCERVKEVRL